MPSSIESNMTSVKREKSVSFKLDEELCPVSLNESNLHIEKSEMVNETNEKDSTVEKEKKEEGGTVDENEKDNVVEKEEGNEGEAGGTVDENEKDSVVENDKEGEAGGTVNENKVNSTIEKEEEKEEAGGGTVDENEKDNVVEKEKEEEVGTVDENEKDTVVEKEKKEEGGIVDENEKDDEVDNKKEGGEAGGIVDENEKDVVEKEKEEAGGIADEIEKDNVLEKEKAKEGEGRTVNENKVNSTIEKEEEKEEEAGGTVDENEKDTVVDNKKEEEEVGGTVNENEKDNVVEKEKEGEAGGTVDENEKDNEVEKGKEEGDDEMVKEDSIIEKEETNEITEKDCIVEKEEVGEIANDSQHNEEMDIITTNKCLIETHEEKRDVGQADEVNHPIDALEALFLEVDKNNDGNVSRKEIMHILNEKDGERSLLKERVCITLGLHPKIYGQEARTVFNAVFDCVDSDNTQTISLIEMRNFVESVDIFVEMYAEIHENLEVAWPVPSSVHRVLKYTKPRKDGTLDHSQIIHSLQKHPDVREAIEDRRLHGPPRTKKHHVKLFSRLTREQSERLDDLLASPIEGLTEEEALDQEMDKEEPLSEEEIAAKATEAYWEGRASAIIAAADNRTNDGCLSVREIQDYLLRGEAPKDDKWFCKWFLIDNMGQNFKRYDHDGSGEIDVLELREALMEWAVFAQAETAKKAAKQRAISKRKKELAAERLEMLRDADARAKEIMDACITDSENGSITMPLLKARIGNTKKFKPFVSWLLKDNMAVFKRFDHDRSGTMEVTELESALDQYFDEVAAEFDQLREDDVGRCQPRVVNGPTPPILRKSGDYENLKVILEWDVEYKGRKLELQAMKISQCSTLVSPPKPTTFSTKSNAGKQPHPMRSFSLKSSKTMKELANGEWTTIYSDDVPTVEVVLSEPSALYIFRLATCKVRSEFDDSEIGGDKAFPREYSAEVFWLGRPDPPTLCGIGCNVLASWDYPTIPSSLTYLRPPIPLWKIHVRKCVHPDNVAQVRDQSFKEGSGAEDWVVTQASPGSSSCAVNGFKTRGGALGIILNRYEVCLSCELPSGHSVLSKPVIYSTTVPAPILEVEAANELSSPPRPLLTDTKQSLSLLMPPVLDSTGSLAEAGLVPVYLTEGINSAGDWEVIYEGSESKLQVHGLPFDTVSLIRVSASLDLRCCSRKGDGPITFNLNQFSSSSGGGGGGGSISSQRVSRDRNLTPAFGCREGVAFSDGTWPGGSRARSLKYNSLLAQRISPVAVSWDVGLSLTVSLPPSPPVFDGDAADFSATLNISQNGNAYERLSILWTKPKGIVPESKRADLRKKGSSLGLLGMVQGVGSSGKLSKDIEMLCGDRESEYVCEVYDTSKECWKRVYRGKEVGCHLSSFDSQSNSQFNLFENTSSCLLFRYGRRFLTPSNKKETKRRHSFVAEKREACKKESHSRARSAGVKRSTHDNKVSSSSSQVNAGEGWMFSRPIVAVLSPPPPLCTWADDMHRGVIVKWGVDMDESKLPKGWYIKPRRFALEVSSGPLISDGIESIRENIDPLTFFEEVADSLGPHQVHSGWLQAGMRYAFRVRLHTDQGSAVSTPYYITTPPTIPSTPLLPSASCSLFRSAIGKESAHVQIRWSEPNGNGCAVDRYALESRSLKGNSSERLGKESGSWGEWKTVYLGPLLIVGDHSTLHTSAKLMKQYRVKAGSKIGWSEWSPVLTVKGECRIPLPIAFGKESSSEGMEKNKPTLRLLDIESSDGDEGSSSGGGGGESEKPELVDGGDDEMQSDGGWSKVTLTELNESSCHRQVSLRCSTNNDGSVTVNSMSLLGSVSTISLTKEEVEAICQGEEEQVVPLVEQLSQRLKVDDQGEVVLPEGKHDANPKREGKHEANPKEEEGHDANPNREEENDANPKAEEDQSISHTEQQEEGRGIDIEFQIDAEGVVSDQKNSIVPGVTKRLSEGGKARVVKHLLLSVSPITYHVELSSGRHTFLRTKLSKTEKLKLSLIFPVDDRVVSTAKLTLQGRDLEKSGLGDLFHKHAYEELGNKLSKFLVVDEVNHTISLNIESNKERRRSSDTFNMFGMNGVSVLPPSPDHSKAAMVIHVNWNPFLLNESSIGANTLEDSSGGSLTNGESDELLEKRIREKVLANLGFSVSEALLKHVVASSIDALRKSEGVGRHRSDSITSLTMMVNTATAYELSPKNPERSSAGVSRPESRSSRSKNQTAVIYPGEPYKLVEVPKIGSQRPLTPTLHTPTTKKLPMLSLQWGGHSEVAALKGVKSEKQVLFHVRQPPAPASC